MHSPLEEIFLKRNKEMVTNRKHLWKMGSLLLFSQNNTGIALYGIILDH
jgi:hypothetical protein